MKQLIFALIAAVLFPCAANAATYYVAKTGSNSYSCTQAQNTATPKSTIASAIGCLSAGDTLNIRAGTYAEGIDSAYGRNVLPAGTSWDNAPVIQAYGDEAVILRPSGTDVVVRANLPSNKYLIFRNLVLDATDVSYGAIVVANGAQYIKFDGIEAKNARSSIVSIGSSDSTGNYVWMTQCKIHHGGLMAPNSNQHHGLYIMSDNNLIELSEIYNNTGFGIHNYGGNPSNNIYRNNWIHDNGNASSTTFGVVLTTGSNNQLYNNLVTNNANGISIGSGTSQKVYNNTLYGNGQGFPCGDFCYPAVTVDAAGAFSIIKNNIFFNNRLNNIGNYGTGSVTSNNLFTDPKLSDPSANNYKLQSSSAAIDAGTSNIASGITIPFSGSAPDIGAFEYQLVKTPPPAPINVAVNSQ